MPSAFERLLVTVSRHLPETHAAGEQLLRQALAWLSRRSPPIGARATAAAAEALECGLSAAQTLADLRLDPAGLAATLLVAALPPAAVATAELAEALGAEVAGLVEGANRLGQVRWDRLEEERAEALRKMFLAMARDVRVVLIVLALRLEQLSRSSGAPAHRLAAETLEVHAPLANRLGVWQFKWQLEDAAFRILEPEAYAELARALAQTRTHREAYVQRCISLLESKLDEAGLSAEVSGRPKHVYSIHRKMQKKLVSFEQVHDLSALRVITERVQDCYAVLGLVHSIWTPVPHEVDDYIAMPKGNGYQSLHTGLVGPEGRVIEIQIRTREMHRFAEFGVAAHWAYKEGKRATAPGQDRFMLLRQLLDWEREVVDPHQLVDALETDIFEDQVFVFTPRGDVIDLTSGSTPVDFAYRIHTEVGHRCRGARVNDQIVPLDYQLQTGDRVEILTHKLPRPSRDWLNPALGYLKTAAGRSKVRHWFREQGRPEAISEGRELVQKELGRLDLGRISIDQLAAELGHESPEDLFAAVGYGDRRSASVTSAALQIEQRQGRAEAARVAEIPELTPPAPWLPPVARGITIDRVSDIQGQRARCCNAVPGDDVVGFVTRGRGLVLHRRTCRQLRNLEPERLVEVHWGALGDDRHSVDIDVTITDRAGVLGDLLKLVANQGAYISRMEAHSTRRGDTSLRLSLDCRDAAHVAQVLERVAHHSEVIAFRRVFEGRA
ncbi:MAG: bifunctional (p)ppGpp synthetase/guanosine-3',5'-bis(diphosphate) 3'-pyrophosphohydrolase [Deltaproteobacteria bacterium]